MSRIKNVGIAAAVALAVVFGISLLGANAAPNYDRTCGVLPGDGYFSYVRVKNMTCRHGVKVAYKSRKKFCRENNDCSMNTDTAIYRGSVTRNGWKCRVTVGWEYSRVKCRKGLRRMVYLTGA